MSLPDVVSGLLLSVRPLVRLQSGVPEKSGTSDRMFRFSLDFAPFRKNLRKNPSREGDGLAFLGKA